MLTNYKLIIINHCKFIVCGKCDHCKGERERD